MTERLPSQEKLEKIPLIGVLMGSKSDMPVMERALRVLEALDIPHEVAVISAHRTPERMFDYAKSAKERGLRVIIAGAGGAAHLPGMIAALTEFPVIGVPIKSKALEGLDSLLSIVQMPSGVPVATVGIDASENAAILACKILAVEDPKLQERLKNYKKSKQV